MEEIGIVKGVSFGMRDCNAPVLWFSVNTLHGGSLQVFNLEDAGRLVEEAGCYDIKQLEGSACVVENDRHVITFIRWHK